MPGSVITVENLGKRYRIRHQRQGGMRYKALRDVLADGTKSVARRLWSAVHSPVVRSPVVSGPRTEDFWALKDISFSVRQGETLGIIGRNGAGKSTLLKILSRITEPTEGRVSIKGRVASLLEVGTGFHPELTGRENIFLNGAILGMHRAEIKRKFDEIVAFAEVEKFLDTPVKRYSSGMYVRLAFAVAAHLEPEILIVDEVLAVGDAEFQKKCLGKMQDVSKGGRTVIFVSHNMAVVQELTARTLLLREGRLLHEGATNTVTALYLRDAVNSDSGEFDLSNHRARQSSRKPLLKTLAIVGEDGVATTKVFPDEDLTFTLKINAADPIKEPRIALAIEDENGRRIMTMASYFSINGQQELSGQCVVYCHVHGLGLGPGKYLVSASIATKNHGLIDSIDSAGWFEVGWRNNYGNGESHLRDYGPVMKISDWRRIKG